MYKPWEELPLAEAPTPCFVVDEARLAHNLQILQQVKERSGAKILLALKGFAMFSVFPLISGTLDGVCASSPHEARLGREEFANNTGNSGKEVHCFAAAYSEQDAQTLGGLVDHALFNSFWQYEKLAPLFRQAAEKAGRPIEFGLRLNPEHSEGAVPIYDPCSPGSRLGIRLAAFNELPGGKLPEGISGLHFHTLCEQNSDSLERTLDVVEKNFSRFFRQIKWLNFGGGHHITRPDYDIDRLCCCVERISKKYGLQVYLEPGEAVALYSGVLVATVLDVVQADMPIVILDASAAAHMPDVLEMPYRPEVLGAGQPGEKGWTCRLAGHSCLAGDVIGEYSFNAPLKAGDRVTLMDMAIYSMVKTNTFNGLALPSIAKITLGHGGEQQFKLVKSFGYEDFRNRLS